MMTTETETETPEVPEPEAAAPPALEPAEKQPFFQRPNVDRYLVPFLLPLAIIVGLAMFVINMSRIFLAGAGTISVIVGTLITISIIAGAATLSAAPKLRSSSLSLVAVGFVGSILLFGWLSLGAAEPHDEGGEALPPEGPAEAELAFNAPAVRFEPASGEGDTGVLRISLSSTSGTHSLVFEDPSVGFPGVEVNTGETEAARGFFGEPGEYGFYCSIADHRAQGMVGTMTITGDPTTLEASLAELEGTEGAPPAEGEQAPPDAPAE